MTVLPAGWSRTTLGDLAETVRNGIFASRPTRDPQGVKILRISAVRDGRVSLDDCKYVSGLLDDQIAKFSLAAGDLLFTRYNGSRRLVGICGLVPEHDGPILHPDKLIRVRVRVERVDGRFLNYQMESHDVRDYLGPRIRTTAGQSGIAGSDIRGIPVLLPPLAEQRKIVDILEDHLSRLDAAESGIRLSATRLAALKERVLAAGLLGETMPGPREPSDLMDCGTADGELPDLPVGWTWRRLGEITDVVGGVTKDSKRQSDPAFVEVPYLRVANVQRGRLDLGKVSHIRIPAGKAEALRLRSGDVLMNEGGDRDKLARGWVWEGQVEDCIHQNHVFRARVVDNAIEPKLLSWAANTIGARWAERNGKQSVNLASISLTKIRQMPIPVPAKAIQPELVKQLDDQLQVCDRLTATLSEALARAARLRRSLLAAAFSGRLTGRSSDLDIAEELSVTAF